MRTIFIITLLAMSLFLSALELSHDIPANIMTGETPFLKLDVPEGFEITQSATLYYKETGSLNFNEIQMDKGSETDPSFTITLEDTETFKGGLGYYFSVLNADGSTSTLPADLPVLNPYRVVIMLPPTYKGDSFVRLSPDPDYTEVGNNFTIAISYYAIEDEIDLDSIKFYLNNKDVTGEAQISKNLLVFDVKEINIENVKYQLKATLKDGKDVESDSWSTKTAVKSYEMPMNMKGKATANFYANSDSRADEANTNGNFRLDLKGRQDWFRFKTKLYLSSLEDSDKQPVNRYNLGMFVPHFDLVFGDYSPNLSIFSMRGKNVRGVYSKLDFSGFRVLTSYGQSKRSIDGVADYSAGTFQRNSLGVRVESGNKKKFTFGLTFAKSKDDVKSLNEEFYLDINDEVVSKPEDNIVLATDFRMAYNDQRVVVGAEIAGSMHNSNIVDGAMSSEEMEDEYGQSIPINPEDYEAIFVINSNMEPFIPSFSSLAYKGYFRAFFAGNLLNISYSGIGSAFHSLSTNVSRTDSGILSVTDNLNFLNNQVSLGLNFNYVFDNLYQTKETTTTSINYNVMTAYRSRTQPIFVSLNFGSNSTENPGIEDSLSFSSATTNFNISTGYTVETIPAAPTKFSVGFGSFSSGDPDENDIGLGNNNVKFSAVSKFDDIPLKTTLAFTTTMTNNDILAYDAVNDVFAPVNSEYNYKSLFAQGEMRFVADKVKTFVNMRLSGFSGDKELTENSFNIGGSYNITKNTYVQSDIGTKSVTYTIPESDAYSVLNFGFKVSQKF
jgi:hypothetical protein